MKKARYYYLTPIRKAMKGLGIVTLTELATRSNVALSVVSKLFRRRSCSRDTMIAIAEALELNEVKLQDHSADMKQASLFDQEFTNANAKETATPPPTGSTRTAYRRIL